MALAPFNISIFRIGCPEKPGASPEESAAELCVYQKLHSFLSDSREKSVSPSQKSLTLRPIQSALGTFSQLGRLSMMDTAAAQSMGSSTGMNLIGGALDMGSASRDKMRAERRGDDKERVVSLVNQIEGAIRAVAGLGYCFFRTAKIYCFSNSLPAEMSAGHLSGRIANYSGLVGDVGFGVSFVLGSALSAYRFYETHKFVDSFKKSSAVLDHQGFEFLTKKLTVNSSAKLKKIRASWDQLPTPVDKVQAMRSFKKKLAESALTALSEKGLRVLGKELSASEARVYFSKCFKDLELRVPLQNQYRAAYAASLGLNLEECQDFTLLELVGFFAQETQRAARKEAKMIRRTSSACTEMVQKAAKRGLFERLSAEGLVKKNATQEYQKIAAKIDETCLAKQKAQLWTIGMSIMGLAMSVIGILSVIGVCAFPPALILVLSLLFVALIVFVDLSGLRAALKEGPVGKWDKLYLVFISVVLALSFATTIGLVVALHLLVIELIKASAIFIAGLGLNLYTFICLKRREKTWKESHPDLDQFKEKLSCSPQGFLTEEIRSLFKKLPKEDRLKIRAVYKTLPFQTGRYKEIYERHGFGVFFLESAFDQKSEMELFERGVKKAARQAWREFQEDKTEIKLGRALKIEAFLETMKSGTQIEIVEEFDQLLRDQAIDFLIQENISYVFKREESQAQLLRAVEIVLEQKRKIKARV